MICNPSVVGSVPLDNSLSSLLQSFRPQLNTLGVGGAWGPNNILNCYDAAAKASALQMIKERDARRKAQGLPALISMAFGFDFNSQDQRKLWWGNSESFWFYGDQGYCIDQNSGAIGFWCAPGSVYEGDYNLSLRQMILDDLAEQSGQVMQLLHSPDDIPTFAPDRLAEAKLAETYRALQAQEEAALQLLAQTQSAGTVAAISTTQTVTDPIGRLVVGQITQKATAGIDLVPTTPGAAPAVGAPADDVHPATPAAAVVQGAAKSGSGTLILGTLAVAATFLMGRK